MKPAALLRIAAVLIAGFAAESRAAVRFDFVAEAPGYTYRGRMTMDGKRLRVDITSGNHPLFNPSVSMISRESGGQILVLDHARKTYFQRAGSPIAGPLATVRGIGASEAVRPRLSKRREPLEGELERYVITAQYDVVMDVGGETVNGTVDMEATFDVDPRVVQRAHPWGLQFATKTGFPNVDEALEKRIPRTLPVRQTVIASRQLAGGPVVTEKLAITVSNVTEEPVPESVFFATAGYRYAEPVFTFGD